MAYTKNERHSQENAYHQQGMERVKNTPPPKDQKFPPGARVKIRKDLVSANANFSSGREATVLCTHAHAFGSKSSNEYCLDIDEVGRVAWYEEQDLQAL